MSQFPPSDQPPQGYGQWQPPQQGYNQPPQWQQPQGYLPQQPMYQQQYQSPQQPPKKSHKGLFIVLGVLAAFLVFGCIGTFAVINAGANSAQQSLNQASTQVAQLGTPQATQPTQSQPGGGKWTTTHTFKGNGDQKTAIFTAPGDWKILYSCTYQNSDGATADGILVVTIYDQTAIPIEVAVDVTCKNGVAHTTGQTEEHQGGQIYLDISTTGPWTVSIQEQK